MKRKNLKKPMISALEQRILFDGAAVATAVDVLDNSSFSTTSSSDSTSKNDVTNNNAENSVHEVQAVQGFEKDRKEVAFVDITVKDYQTLVDGIGAGVETYLVSSFDEINSILQNQKDIDAIHILSHGSTGEITVGNDVLNKESLNNFNEVLQSMKNSLTQEGDILLYGCNIANDGSGQEFIDTISTLTQADVAASDDSTGSSALGGDWDLEKSNGFIDTNTISVTDYNDILSLSVVVEHGNTVETYDNISSGVAHLTSGGNAVAYLVQTSGDMNVDGYSGYSGIIQVTDSSTTVIKSIDMTEHLSDNSNFISDMSITSLKNGGFVVVWTEGNASDFTLNKYYEIFDNNGNQVGSNPFNLLTATDGGNIKVTSLTNGGFAVAFLNGQTGIVKTYEYNSGSFTANSESIFIENVNDVLGANAGDSTTPTTYGPDASDVRRLFALGSLSITNLSDGSFVVACSTYDWVNSSYTPLGDFIYKFNADGTKSSFSGGSGQYWERVNWNPGQTNNITALTSFDGGFASLNKGNNGEWQITVYNNDGSLTTTNKLTDTVYYGGNYYNKYYYAVNLGAITSNLSNLYGNQNTYANDFQVDLEFDGTNLVAILPNDTGGLSIANISTTTGNLIGSITTLSDIPVPSGKNITNPHYLTTSSGFSLLYDVQSTNTVTINDPGGDWDATYVLSDVYQYDLLTFSPPDTIAPTFDVTPATSNVTATTVDLSASLDEAGKIYYVVVPDGSTAPSLAQILAGQDSSGSAALKSGNSDVATMPFTGTYNITGLSANTAYDIYVIGQDDEGTPNVMTTATKVDVTTPHALITFESGNGVLSSDNSISMTYSHTGTSTTFTITAKDTSDQQGHLKYGSLVGDPSGHIGSESIYAINEGKANSITFSVENGKTFDLISFYLSNQNGDGDETFTITTNKGGSTTGISGANISLDSDKITLPSTALFQGITSFTITAPSGGAYMEIDDIVLQNIMVVGPTVNPAIGTYTDTSANDTFANTTGTISAIPSSGLITGYGISGGITGGNSDVEGTTYDVSKAGTYGTLYVNSTTGVYVYEPTSDSVINATSTTVTDTFTIQATDSNGTGNGTLTITINGVNDTPELTTPTSASYTDTSAYNTFTNTIGTLSASDRDSNTTLTYGISTGITGGSTNVGGTIYDILKVGNYGILYVKSSDGSYVYVPSANAINALTSNATDTFTVSTSDGNASDTQTFTVNITGLNDTPTANGNRITINEDTTTLLSANDFNFSDIDTGSELSTIKITSLETAGMLEYYDGASWIDVTLNQEITKTDIDANKLRFTPFLNANGEDSASFNFKVSDGTVYSDSAYTIIYDVTAVNDTPTVVNEIVNQNASISNAFSFTVPSNSFVDVDTSDTLAYTAQLVDSNGNLVSGGTLPSWLTFTAGTRTFSGTPAIGDVGTIYVKVTATDNGTGNLNVSDIFTITTNSGPTVSAVTDTYTDTSVNDTFTNKTGTIGATASSGTITGYGISTGTTGGSDTIGSVTYDVSKVGTYGTLYVNSTTGAYVYEPTSDSVINATSTTVTDVFTIQATDGSGTTDNSLTITINGVNDTPELTTPTSASYTDTSAYNTFTNTTGTLSASDRDSNTTLTYGISTGITGGSTNVGGTIYDISKVGNYGILYVKSSDGSYVYVPSANAINALTSNATDTFTVSTSDGNASDTQTFTVNITGTNDKPTANGTRIVINEDTSTVLSASDFGFADVDTGSLLSKVQITNLVNNADGVLEYKNGEDWISVIENQEITKSDIDTGRLRFNPTENANGEDSASFQFKVSDGTFYSDSAYTIIYDITSVNDAPTLDNIIADQNASVSNAFSFTVPSNSFVDVDINDTLTYSAQLVDSNGNLVSGGTLPSWLTFTAGTRTFSGTPAIGDVGTIYVKVTATDNGTGNLNVSDIFTITTNSGPTVSAVTDTYTDTSVNDTFTNKTGTIGATASSGTITGYGISTGTTGGSDTIGSVTYDVSKVGTYGILYVKSSTGDYVYVPTSDSVINATSTTVTDVFTIQATDGSGTTDNSLTITINGVNDTPTVVNMIENQTVTQNSIYNFQFSSNIFSDADSGDIQTYTAQLVDSNGNLINGGTLPAWLTFTSGTRTFSGIPTNDDIGILNVKVTAIDGSNEIVSNTFSLTVVNVNDAPTGNVIISGTLKQGETLTASNTIADVDGLGTISYQWYADGLLINGATNSTYVLTQNEVDKVITVKANYTDAQSTNEIVTSSATTSIVNVNDAPTVSSENIDVTVPFGNDYIKNISTLFNDIDNSDTFTFEAINLPSGLSIDPITGIISGKPTLSGNFIIIIKGTDSGTPALSVSRTYNMLVLAPAQIIVDAPTTNTATENNTIPTESNTNLSLNIFTDTTNLGVLNNSKNEGNIDNPGEGFISSSNPQDNPSQNTTEIPTQTNIQTDNGKGIIQSNVDLNVSTNGQISFNQGNQDSFSIVGITIEDIKVENGNLEIKVVDTNLSQNFIVTQSDGTSLPTGLSFDPKTGSISGTIPENLEKLEISIKSVNTDGTTKILNLKLDLKQLKQKTQAEAESFIGLKEQIALENQKNDGYGSYLTKLFA